MIKVHHVREASLVCIVPIWDRQPGFVQPGETPRDREHVVGGKTQRK
jgi:hypothetical protein